MNDKEYLEIILIGWCEDSGGNLTNHIYREWKKAEASHYSLTEFFGGLVRQQKGLTANIDCKSAERRHEVSIIRGIWKSEGKDIKELEGQEDIQYSLNLWHITNDPKYLGFTLWQSNIDYIGGQIADAFERANKEKNTVNEPEPKITHKSQNDNLDETIPVLDFGSSVFNRKVPFEIEMIFKYGPPYFDFIYTTLDYGEGKTQIEQISFRHFEKRISKGEYYTEEFKKIDNENSTQYYKSYADGFVKGYNEFDKTIENATKIFDKDIQNKVRKVFQYIIEPVPLLGGSNLHKLDSNPIKFINVIKNSTCFDNGVKAGKKYKAWFYIIENPIPFIPLFRNHLPFVGFYRKAYEHWKIEQGYEGMVQRLQKLLNEFDGIDQANGTRDDRNKKNNDACVKDEIDIVKKHIYCLSGYWMKCKIMTNEEFENLINYARYTMENGKLPKMIKPIDKGTSGLSKLFYQHTIYRLWKEISKERKQRQALWIDFVKKIFKDQYKNTDHDLSKSFSRYAKGKSGYDLDKQLITY